MSVAVTALLCGCSFGASGTFGCCGLLVKRSFWDLPVRVLSGMLLNGFLSLWNQLADVLGKKAGIYLTIYQIKESGNANGELAVLIFLGIACGLLGFLILKLRLVCAAPSFCSSTSGGSGKNRLASRYQALSWLLRRNPVRIKLYDQKQRGKLRYRFRRVRFLCRGTWASSGFRCRRSDSFKIWCPRTITRILSLWQVPKKRH